MHASLYILSDSVSRAQLFTIKKFLFGFSLSLTLSASYFIALYLHCICVLQEHWGNLTKNRNWRPESFSNSLITTAIQEMWNIITNDCTKRMRLLSTKPPFQIFSSCLCLFVILVLSEELPCLEGCTCNEEEKSVEFCSFYFKVSFILDPHLFINIFRVQLQVKCEGAQIRELPLSVPSGFDTFILRNATIRFVLFIPKNNY